ncbi:putative porin [Microbulbifer sp. OS29]|uniref:Porin n=1 Tax=Microbulbifer okhotskensis TaxID=2926617 RepID=A0A9X2EIF8_9GAMM|nr:putative porin [Microbulbifer okhotskensis]MCO1332827.1 putative porin [Microbulbifer okhotskensis]
MRFKLAALPLMLLAATAGAEEYNSITTAGYSNLDFDGADGNQFTAETTYYFGGKEALGPLKEFEYINKVSNVSAAYSHYDVSNYDTDNFAVAGEYFAGNGFMFGANLTEVADDNVNTVALGYLFTPNFLVKLSHTDFDSDDETFVEFRYNHQLSGSDYIGFDFVTDDDFDASVLSSKYFTNLGGDQYLTAEFSYADYDGGDDYWQIGADYFFTQNTSVGLKLDENEDMKLAFSHFFNRNVAVEAAYSTMLGDGMNIRSFGNEAYGAGSADIEVDKFELGLTVQL